MSKRDLSGRPAVHVVFGTALLSTASITKLVLQCILIPVLARVLGPSIFGEMSIAMSFVLLGNVLSDGGMCTAIIREQEVDRELESTVWWLSTFIGFALAGLICAIAWPIAVIYRQPELFTVLLALAPILVAGSGLSVANARIVRWQRFDVFAAGDIGSAFVGAALGLWLALRGFGIWSLVFQQLGFWAVKAVWVTIAADFWPEPVFHIRCARPLFRFSANNLATNIADFLGKNAPVFIVGGFIGPAAVARFSMSYQLTRVAELVVSNPVNLATLSGVVGHTNRRTADGFALAALRILLLTLLPVFCGLMLTADILVPIVLGGRWANTALALAALAPGALVLCLSRFATAVMLGKGRSGRALKLTLLTGVATALGTLAGVRYGVTWAVAGFSAGALLSAPVYVWSLARLLQIPITSIAAAARTSAIATLAMSSAVWLLRMEIHALVPIVQLVLVIVCGAATFVMAATLAGAKEIRRDIQRLRSMQHEKQAPRPADWPYLPSASELNAPVESAA